MSGILSFIAAVEPVDDSIIVAITAFLGIGIGTTVWIKKEKDNRNQIRILKYINKNRGKATLTELVLALELPVQSTKKIIEKLQNHGMITLETTDKGELLYCCQDIILLQEKYKSFQVL